MGTQFWKSNPLSFFDLIFIKISLFFLVKITLSFKCKYLKWLRAFMSKIDYSLNKNIRGDKFSNMRSISSLLTNYFLSRRCCSFQGPGEKNTRETRLKFYPLSKPCRRLSKNTRETHYCRTLQISATFFSKQTIT